MRADGKSEVRKHRFDNIRRAELSRPLRGGLVRLRKARREARLPRLPLVSDAIGRRRLQSLEGITPEAAQYVSRNFRFGVLNGVLFSLSDSLIGPALVLAWFVNGLGAPNVVVGALPVIATAGSFLPQLLIAGRVQGQSHVMHWYSRMGAVRVLCIAALAFATFMLAAQPGTLLVVFFAVYLLYAVAGGIGSIPWLEIVSKTIPIRRRGTFLGLRSFWGGLLALAAAGPLAAVMSGRVDGLDLPFPYNFALVFAAAAVLIAAGVWAWSAMKEPAALPGAIQVSVVTLVRKGFEALKMDGDYRSYTLVRGLMSLASISDPFYAVFARTQLGAPAATIGLYLAASTAASLLSNFFWSPLGDRASHRTLVLANVLSVALVPLTALAISLVAGKADPTVRSTAFALAFVFGGLAAGAGGIVNNNVLLAIAPHTQRATYIGFLNTVLGLVSFVAILGGVIADTMGYSVLFLVSVVLVLSALVGASRMSTKRAI
jgi:MFS family permease